MNKVFDFLSQANEDDRLMFANDINTLILDVYYTRFWKEDTWSYERSGKVFTTEVNMLRPKSVLDVGCGNNLFKDHIYDLYGIDAFNQKADEVITLANFQQTNPDKQFDVVMALDSLNHGRKPDLIYNFEFLDKLTAPGGHQFWRVNPEPPEAGDFPLLDLVDFIPWDEKLIRELADCNGYEVKEICEETNADGEKRLFFCFYKY